MTRRDVCHAPHHAVLKRDTKALIRAAGGLEAAAQYSRPNKTVLSDYQSASTVSFMPIDVIADLEAVTRDTAGWPLLTRRLATMNGCSLVALPEPGSLDGNWFEQIATLTGDYSKVSQRLCNAASDGKVTADEVEAADLISACDEAIHHLVNLRARFERIAEEG